MADLEQSQSLSLNGRVSKMPDDYQLKKTATSSNRPLILGVGVAIIVLTIILVITVIILSQNQIDTTSIDNQADSTQVETNTDQNSNQDSSNDSIQQDDQTEQQEESNDFLETIESDSNLSIILPDFSSQPNQQDIDTDQDGLTDSEEALLKTNTALPDTDGDGFLDGSEVLKLYDPSAPVALLDTSEQIKVGKNERYQYQFLLPSDWSTVLLQPSGEELLIRPQSGTERMTINIYENTERVSVTEWLKSVQPDTSLNDFINFSNSEGWKGIQTVDKRTIIATYGDDQIGARAYIYVLHYDVGNEQFLRYQTIWNMIANSLSILEVNESSTNDEDITASN